MHVSPNWVTELMMTLTIPSYSGFKFAQVEMSACSLIFSSMPRFVLTTRVHRGCALRAAAALQVRTHRKADRMEPRCCAVSHRRQGKPGARAAAQGYCAPRVSHVSGRIASIPMVLRARLWCLSRSRETESAEFCTQGTSAWTKRWVRCIYLLSLNRS